MQIIGKEFDVSSTSYKVVEELKSGGFGTVYKAEPSDGSDEPPLLVKVPALHVLQNDAWRRRFQREARILGNISHPNVVETNGLLSYSDGGLLLVQEYLRDAVELLDWSYSEDAELLSVALQVLYGLRCTHGTSEDARAIHRDLSPRNILVSVSGRAKIIDFGLAKEDPRTTEILTIAGEAFGTPGCMAPEQQTDTATVDHRADLYALGRTLASCIQNRPPQFVEINKLPEPWAEIIQQLTEYDADLRFSDAESAIVHFLARFERAGILPSQPLFHFQEFAEWENPPEIWIRVAARHFQDADRLDFDHLTLAYCVKDPILSSEEFEIDLIFKRLEAEAIADHFGDGSAAFSACDKLGGMIRTWYPWLGLENKLQAYRRLCQIAVYYHRYSCMGALRTIYKVENDSSIAESLLDILEEKDSTHVVEGRGIIPR